MFHLVELKQIASDAGVMHANDLYSNAELIRAIQGARKDPVCYLTDARFTCDSRECEWQSSCQKLVAIWNR
jgi:hypothetical protein